MAVEHNIHCEVKLWGEDISHTVAALEVKKGRRPRRNPDPGLIIRVWPDSAVVTLKDGTTYALGLQIKANGNLVWLCPALALMN